MKEMSKMELRQLEYFAAVARLKNYTRAADEMYVSQPTISVSIQKLEEELGTKLIIRDNKKVILTHEGEIFLAHTEKLLGDAKNLQELIKDMAMNKKRILKMAFPSTVGSWLWPVVIERFPFLYPDIEIEFKDIGTLEIIDALLNDDIELGYGVVEWGDNENIEIQEVKEMEIKVIVGPEHPFAKKEAVSIGDLYGEDIIMYKKGTTFTEERITEELLKLGISPNYIYVMEQSTVFDVVSQGLAISVTLDDSISIIKDTSSIIAKSFEKPIRFKTGLMWNKNRYLSVSARSFIDYIITECI